MRKHYLLLFVVSSLIGITLVGCHPNSTEESSPSQDPVITRTVQESPTPEDDAVVKDRAEATVQIPEIGETQQEKQLTGSVDKLVSELEGLSLADFFEISFGVLTKRSPETVLTFGLTENYGVTEIQLDDISDAYQQETYQMMSAILEMLKGYERAALSPDEQISYDIYQWYLEDQLAGQDFRYHNYPATYFPPTAVQEDLLKFFTDIHPINHLQDAKDYVTRLSLVGAKIDQLIEYLENSRQAGITPPQFAIQWSIYGSLGQFVNTPALDTRLYTALKEKLDPMSSGTPDEKQAILEDAERVITDVVLPAYQSLASYLAGLETYPGGDSGVWRLPQGEAYYNHQLRHFTTLSISSDEIHQLGNLELERIHSEMRAVFDQLGYPPDETIVQAYDRVARDGGHISGNEVLGTYENLIREVDKHLGAAFDIFPKADVIVLPDPFGDYYVLGSIDGSRPGAFYAGVDSTGRDYYAMPTLAYHETVPGHHLQISIAQEMEDLPSFRRGLTFTAFVEGWALYAEHLAWELGFYENDPYGYLGLLQYQAFRAARLVVDTGLHSKGWTFDQAQEFFTANTGFEMGDNVNPQNEIARYLVWPGQSVSYYMGYQKLLELRQHAMDELGDQFDLIEFHRVVLSNGSMPLEVFEQVIEQYIQNKLNG